MAKTKENNTGGTVYCSMGMTIPATPPYSGIRFDIGITLPIQAGESVDQAEQRVAEKVYEKLVTRCDELADVLDEKILRTMNKRKTPGR